MKLNSIKSQKLKIPSLISVKSFCQQIKIIQVDKNEKKERKFTDRVRKIIAENFRLKCTNKQYTIYKNNWQITSN